VEYLNSDGYKVKTNQEVAEVYFIPEIKNTKKSAPVFRYLAIREGIFSTNSIKMNK